MHSLLSLLSRPSKILVRALSVFMAGLLVSPMGFAQSDDEDWDEALLKEPPTTQRVSDGEESSDEDWDNEKEIGATAARTTPVQQLTNSGTVRRYNRETHQMEEVSLEELTRLSQDTIRSAPIQRTPALTDSQRAAIQAQFAEGVTLGDEETLSPLAIATAGERARVQRLAEAGGAPINVTTITNTPANPLEVEINVAGARAFYGGSGATGSGGACE